PDRDGIAWTSRRRPDSVGEPDHEGSRHNQNPGACCAVSCHAIGPVPGLTYGKCTPPDKVTLRASRGLSNRKIHCSGKGPPMYKHILIATDGSELADKALDHGLSLAKAAGATATVVIVTEPVQAFEIAQTVRTGGGNPFEQYEAAWGAHAKRIRS